ncbi:hypothetical protein G7046_g7797 [Stylonectria norvegica]|nr:hypothetical protein G7046_g7797 [Stylonectria norvegica]
MSRTSPAVEDGLLDQEIDALQKEAASLRQALNIETSTILSSASTRSSLQSKPSMFRGPEPSNAKIISQTDYQRAHIQQCLHRICTSVTSFKVHDPDPNAVGGGHVLGLRFEIMSKSQFLRPYYVMLNRPYFNSTHLRVHRHTLPQAIPLAGLAARHLPAPRPESDSPPEQDLERFVRTMRREIVRYHNRLGVSADLRRGLGLHKAPAKTVSASDIVDVGIADIEAKQIRFSWADERSGRVVMDNDGKVLKLLIFGKKGRDWETTKELYGKYERVEDVTKRLQEYAHT